MFAANARRVRWASASAGPDGQDRTGIRLLIDGRTVERKGRSFDAYRPSEPPIEKALPTIICGSLPPGHRIYAEIHRLASTMWLG